MTSSKTTSRKAPPRKTPTRKTALSNVTGKSAASMVEPTDAQAAVSTQPTPPVALAAGQEPSPLVVTAEQPTLTQPALGKKELITAAVERSGVKKKDAKPVVEALLAILGETVAAGRDLNLKPFGKLHLNRSEARSNGTVHVCRLRQPLAENPTTAENSAEGEETSQTPLATVEG